MKNEFVVKEKIKNHDDYGSESEGAGGLNKLVGEGEMKERGNIEGELVEWGN